MITGHSIKQRIPGYAWELVEGNFFLDVQVGEYRDQFSVDPKTCCQERHEESRRFPHETMAGRAVVARQVDVVDQIGSEGGAAK